MIERMRSSEAQQMNTIEFDVWSEDAETLNADTTGGWSGS